MQECLRDGENRMRCRWIGRAGGRRRDNDMNFLKSPLVKTVLVVLATIVVLNILRPTVSKIPVVGQYL